jgi:hypothetical protein
MSCSCMSARHSDYVPGHFNAELDIGALREPTPQRLLSHIVQSRENIEKWMNSESLFPETVALQEFLAYRTTPGICLRGTVEDVVTSERIAESIEKRVDLIFTSPPFPLNLKKGVGFAEPGSDVWAGP